MGELKQFRLPDVGEGLTEGEVLTWHVKPGDTVVVNQVVVEVETAKAAVELPIPWAGVVTSLDVEVGATVPVGTPLLTVDVGSAAGPAGGVPLARSHEGAARPAAVPVAEPAPAAPEPAPHEGVRPGVEFVPTGARPQERREAVLVGYGVRDAAVTRRPRRPRAAAAGSQPATSAVGGVRPQAKPPVRKLARDLGVDLATLTPTGPGGTLTREDVLAGRGGEAGVLVQPDVALTGAVVAPALSGDRREPVHGIRKHMAEAMVRSAFTIPHVTVWTEVDVTRSVRLTRRLRETPGFDDVRVTPLLLVARAVLLALTRNPDLNAVFDADAQEVVYREHVNLGIAAATPRGLIVPNIKGADLKSLPELAAALDDLVRTAREGRTAPGDMTNGTFTITNVGVFGVDGGTPIINPGEGAILAVGAFRERPWVHKGRVRARWVAELTVSFDHRHIDGAMGSRFLADVAAVLADPAVAVSWS
ncbi:MAG TPA: dihydrolipoamide acetyltransferase family protein [Actinomycetes bacterium]|nr:dihydrolipoamide acetyltransferase family protein [Actinomycetes bacterium]